MELDKSDSLVRAKLNHDTRSHSYASPFFVFAIEPNYVRTTHKRETSFYHGQKYCHHQGLQTVPTERAEDILEADISASN